MALLILAEGEGTPTTLGHRVGRWRQQVHRALERLEQKGIVEAAHLSRRGKVAAWKLAPKGRLTLTAIQRRMETPLMSCAATRSSSSSRRSSRSRLLPPKLAELAAQAEREDLESIHEAWRSLWR